MSMGLSMVRNKKAKKDYHLEESFNAGIVLKGGEIKSIRSGDCSITDSYCVVEDSEIFLKDSHIKNRKNATILHEEKRNRKLLLKKNEIKRITKALEIKGLSLIPISLFINERGFCKVNIAIGKGKKLYDKRNDLKAKAIEKDKVRYIKDNL